MATKNYLSICVFIIIKYILNNQNLKNEINKFFNCLFEIKQNNKLIILFSNKI